MASKKSQKQNARLRGLMVDFSIWYAKEVRPVIKDTFQAWKRGANAAEAFTDSYRERGIPFRVTERMQKNVISASAIGLGTRPGKVFTQNLLNSNWSGQTMVITRLQNAPTQMMLNTRNLIQTSIRRGDAVLDLSRSLFDGFGNAPDVIPFPSVQGDQLRKEVVNLRRKAKSAGIGTRDLKRLDKIREDLTREVKTPGLRAAYKNLLDAIEEGVEEGVEKALEVAIAEKGRYAGDRIARSEMQRGFYQGFNENAQKDNDVVGYRFDLSPAHEIFDICDFHTSADFGLGPGVYPKDMAPSLPFHPNCLCQVSEVFRGEVDPKNLKSNAANANKYLRKLNARKQKQLLGVSGRKAWKEDPENVFNYLKNYQGLEFTPPLTT